MNQPGDQGAGPGIGREPEGGWPDFVAPGRSMPDRRPEPPSEPSSHPGTWQQSAQPQISQPWQQAQPWQQVGPAETSTRKSHATVVLLIVIGVVVALVVATVVIVLDRFSSRQ